MFYSPLGQFVPFISGAPINGQPELHVLVLALLQVCHHLLRSSDTNSQQGASASLPVIQQLAVPRAVFKSPNKHLDNVTEVFPLNVVVCFDEDLSQDRFPNRIVFGIELVKAVKSVAVLGEELEQRVKLLPGVSILFDDFNSITRQHRLSVFHHSPRACPGCPHSGQRLSGSCSRTPPSVFDPCLFPHAQSPLGSSSWLF